MVEHVPTWFALQVKPRHEFLVHSDLARNGIETFLPVVSKMSQWKDRKKRIDFPLFPGYIFARVLPISDCFMALLKTRGTIRILSTIPGKPTSVPDTEISALKALLASDKELDINPELKPGKLVRIKNGVFSNVEGVVSNKGEEFFLHVNISMLGRCVTVKLFECDVEVI